MIAAATCLVLGILVIFAGYGMSRFRFRAKTLVILLFLLAQMLPAVVLIVPLFNMFRVMGLINTPWVLIVTYTTTLLPFAVLMMRGFYEHPVWIWKRRRWSTAAPDRRAGGWSCRWRCLEWWRPRYSGSSTPGTS